MENKDTIDSKLRAAIAEAVAVMVADKHAKGPSESNKLPNKIIYIHETLRDSIISDCFTYGGMGLIMVAGHMLNSQAAQWIGFLSFVIMLGSGRMMGVEEMCDA